KSENISEAVDMPPMDKINPPGIVQAAQENTPGYWYNKLNLSQLEDKFKLPSKILLHLIDIESKGNPQAKSKLGARGLFGIMPKGVSGFNGDINDAKATAIFAAETLRYLIDHFGNIESGLAAYNWGMGNLRKKGLHKASGQTKHYIKFFKEKGIIPQNGSWGEESQIGSWGEIAGMKPN
ncbi:MAG: lytic transglycosylase domain-containing protein, partial [Ignisphaera sp.]|nr:lytic transglycosylase domain-containing protein [Ignisphaera sp.]